MDLLHKFILEKRPKARVFHINAWWRSDLEHLDLEDRWRKAIKGWDGYRKDDFYLIDEGHSSYWDEPLWKDFKDRFQRASVADAPYVVLFCSFNEELRKTFGITPPVVRAKLTLSRITSPPNGAEDMTPIGLLLDRKEYDSAEALSKIEDFS
jgi:hypothetical protein